MSNVQEVVRRSIIATISPEEEAARRQEIRNLPNPIKRMVALALHEVTIHHSDCLAPFVGLEKSKADAEFIDAGFDALVFREGAEVVKVHKPSLSMDHARQTQMIRRRTAVHKVMRGLLSDYTLPQHTSLGSHPWYPTLPAVTTRQEHIAGLEDTNLFGPNHRIDTDSFDTLARRPGVVKQLSEFVTASVYMRNSEQLLPDLWGRKNLVLAGNKLLMIDGQPLALHDPANETVSAETNERLNNLHLALATV